MNTNKDALCPGFPKPTLSYILSHPNIGRHTGYWKNTNLKVMQICHPLEGNFSWETKLARHAPSVCSLCRMYGPTQGGMKMLLLLRSSWEVKMATGSLPSMDHIGGRPEVKQSCALFLLHQLRCRLTPPPLEELLLVLSRTTGHAPGPSQLCPCLSPPSF